MAQEAVDLVRQDELFHLDLPLPQRLDQVDRLDERHVAVVVAVDHQHRRPPAVDQGSGDDSKGAPCDVRVLGVVVRA